MDFNYISNARELALVKKAEKNKPKVEKYGFWGLVLFVGIPIPGTGAWTGSLVAGLFEMDRKRSFIAVCIRSFACKRYNDDNFFWGNR